MSKQTIIFIHGAWVTARCWDKFIEFFEGAGYDCIAPNWPYNERSLAELRESPDPRLTTIGVAEIVDHYAKIITELDQPPIIIGHSFGGLFTQMLLDQGLGMAGVAINSAPPKGILATPAAIRGNLAPLMTWMGWQKVLTMSRKTFTNLFGNGIPTAEQDKAYNAQIVPTPGRVFFQAATAPFHNTLAVNFKNKNRAPLLLIAGSIDKTVPAELNRANYKKYGGESSEITTFKEFPNQSHTIILEPGWEEVATYALNWLETLPERLKS